MKFLKALIDFLTWPFRVLRDLKAQGKTWEEDRKEENDR